MLKTNKRGTQYLEEFGKIIAKECTKCKEILPLCDYVKATKRFAGVASSCKNCGKGYFESYYMLNKEKILTQSKEYYLENRVKVIARTTKYQKDNPEVNKKAQKKWRKTNKVKLAETKRNWRIKNLDACKKREQVWRYNNKEKVILKAQRRRALKRQLPNNLTHEQHESLLAHFEFKCPLTSSLDIHLDHFIPLSIGHGGTTVGNLIPLDATLNVNKQAQNPFEWFKQNSKQFGLDPSKFDEVVMYLAEKNEMTFKEYREYVYWCFENPCEITIETEESQCH